MSPDQAIVMRPASRIARSLLTVALPFTFGACQWFTDFKTQPQIEPWESPSQNPNDTTTPPRGNPMYSVPVQGSQSPALLVSYMPAPATLDSLASIPNPVAIDANSLEKGRRYYQINCAVCHGMAGAGGPTGTMARVNPAYAWSPSLLTDMAMGRTDGYIFGIIRNGRGAMPSYNRIEENERWHVVNYVRALQGRAGTPADTTLVGLPGQNGTTVPGASLTAPTRPTPYVHPGAQVTPGSPGINSATFKGHNDAPKQGAATTSGGHE